MEIDLVVETVWHGAAGSHVRPTRVGRDREPAGYGNPELGHLGEADPLAPEKLAPSPRVLVEVVHVAHLREESTRIRLDARIRIVQQSFLS